MLTINQEHFIGRGYHRECYLHPSDPDRCIKVVVNGDDSETKRELAYYQQLNSRQINWEMLPKFHEWTITNKGEGAVFDLVRDFTGEVSQSLNNYLTSAEVTAAHFSALQQALPLFRTYLLTQNILTMTLKAKNILFKRLSPEEGRLVLIDNIGNSDFIPICNYVDFLAKRKITRKLQRFEQSLLIEHPENSLLPALLGLSS